MKIKHLAIAFRMVVILIMLTPGSVLSVSPTDVQGKNVQDIRLFYEKLAPHGEWVRLDPHGWVWVPPALAPAWRPYTFGRWVVTEVGMTWVSAWPWGWATFHYGRWAFNTQYGWVWIPGTLWAPAWVAWQVGNGWVGWAPLPPQATWDPIQGLSAERVDLLDIEALRYVFVAAPQLLAAELQQHVVAAARSVTLLQQSRNITTYAVTAGRVHNHSLSSTQVAQLVGHAIPHHQLSDIDTVSTELRTQIDGERVLMFRPLLMQPEPGRDTSLPEPTPPPTPPPPTQAEPAPPQSAARRALDDRLADEYARLLARHEDERKRAAQQEEKQDVLRQQHERERRAFDIYAEQERQVLDNRLKRKSGKVQFRLYYNEPTGQSPALEP